MKYVICIDNHCMKSILTEGKIYKIVNQVFSRGNKYLTIVDDRGNEGGFYPSRFKPLKGNKINKLLYKEIECQ